VPGLLPALGAVGLLACHPDAVVDVGSTWVSPAPLVGSMQWTSDSQTLLYASDGDKISAIHLGSGSPRVLAEGSVEPHLVKTSSGDVVFFLRPDAGSPAQFECMQAPLLGEVLGTPRLVASVQTAGYFVVSAQG